MAFDFKKEYKEFYLSAPDGVGFFFVVRFFNKYQTSEITQRYLMNKI